MSLRERLENSWDAAAKADPAGKGLLTLQKTGVSTNFGMVLVGLDSEGRRHLCLPTSDAEIGSRDDHSRGVIIQAITLLENSVPRPFVDVLCKEASLNALFSIVASDMLDSVTKDPERPFIVCQETLNLWRQLLENERVTFMSKEEIGGLFTELLLLEKLATIRPTALISWQGPDRGLHDFVCGGMDIEVKSTRSPSSYNVEISDLNQLAIPKDVALYLVFNRIRSSPGRGRSLLDIIDIIIRLGVDRPEFFRKLQLYGYDQRDAEHYRQLTYELCEECWFKITPLFPRIVNESFCEGRPPKEVKKIHYTLDLAGIAEPLTETMRADVLERAATMGGG